MLVRWVSESISQHSTEGEGNGSIPFSSVQFSGSVVSNSVTPWTAARQASLSITNSWSLLKLMSIESVVPSNHLILCCPLLLLPSIFPSIRGFFKWVSSSHQVAKVLEFQFQHQSFQWIFRTDFLWDGLVWSPCSPRGLSSVFSNTTVQKHQFFSVQLSLWSNSHMRKKIALTRCTFVAKVRSLLFNMLSRFIITFLPRRRKYLLILWLQSLQWFWSPRK